MSARHQDLRFALNRRFRDDQQAYVGINMLMYWVKGDKIKSLPTPTHPNKLSA